MWASFCDTFTLAVTSGVSCRALLLLALPRSPPPLFSVTNCVGVWQKPWQVERQTELTDCWHLHSQCAWIKYFWQGLLFCFSGDVWWILKQSELRVSSCAPPNLPPPSLAVTHDGHISPSCVGYNIFSLCHPLCSPVSTVKATASQGTTVWGPKTPCNTVSYSYIQDGVCSY